MHDPKFEKEVQQKLEELSFSPSEAVWTRVERAVNGEKKRRVPLFWFFLLPALTLTGAGAIYFSHTRTAPVATQTATAPARLPAAVTPTAVTPGTVTPATVAPAQSPGTRSALSSRGADRESPAVDQTAGKGTPAVAGASTAKDVVSAASTGKNNVTGTSRSKNVVTRPSTSKDVVTGSSTDKDIFSETSTEQQIATGTTGKEQAVTAADAERAKLPGLKTLDRQFAAPSASHLSAQSKAATSAKTLIQLKPKYSWEAGFAGGIGASSLNKTLFEQPAAVVSDVRSNSNTTTINGAVPKSYTSRIRPDLSYWAGIVVQRPLNMSLTLSLGLSLHYYSAKIQVGEKVNYAPSNYAQSLFTAQNQIQAAAYPYYSVGDKDVFTNRYYFLELPASVLWKVNHSRNLPLFWESGLSLAYLMSSNALYYNAKSSVFYKDGGVISKTQINLATALLVGIPIKGMRLQAGPQIQYGLTTLQNQGSSGQHLFYGGLRVVLLPGKIKK